MGMTREADESGIAMIFDCRSHIYAAPDMMLRTSRENSFFRRISAAVGLSAFQDIISRLAKCRATTTSPFTYNKNGHARLPMLALFRREREREKKPSLASAALLATWPGFRWLHLQ